ncbi:MAG TPA: hypothetical protein VGJ45_14180 [Pseudonocardiaceae bacterium]
MNDHTDEVRARYAAAAERLADVPVAQAGLSCGTPVADIELRAGDVVLDLGSGAGGDVLAAARRVGPAGSGDRAGHDARHARPRPPPRR